MGLIQKAFGDIVTFSRSSNATRIGPTGRVEYAPHNLLTYSEQFDNAAWVKSGCSVSANAATAPNGTVTAELVTASTSSSFGFVYNNGSGTFSGTFTVSVYAKQGTQRYIQFASTGSAAYWANFDLQDGLAYAGGTTSAVSIVSVGGGWYRCSATVTNSATNQHAIGFVTSLTAGQAQTNTLNTNFYAWGAQVSVGPLPLDYTPTTSAAVYGPRFDFDPVTLAARGLLIEEQRTNLFTYSEQFDNAAWSKFNTTVTANAATSPDGQVTADKLFDNSVNGGHYAFQIISLSAVSTFSVFAKASEITKIAMQIQDGTVTSNNALLYFNLSTGTVESGDFSTALSGGTIASVGNGWYLCTLTYTPVASRNHNLRIFCAKHISGNKVDYIGNGTDGVLLWGAQLEAGAFATSYIPTVASTVTRSADVASVNTLSPWYNATEGSLLVQANVFAAYDIADIVELGDGTYNNRIFVYTSASSNANFAVDVSGSRQAALSGSISANAPFKISAAYKANDFAASVNGASASTDTSGTIPTVTTLYFGRQGGGGGALNGHIRRIAYYPRRLTNAELTAISA